jgi:hypothetical protein
MEKRLKMLGMGCILLVFIFVGFGCLDSKSDNPAAPATTATSNFSGDWEGTFQETWSDIPNYNLRSGILHNTVSQTNDTVTATGWCQYNDDPLSQKAPFTRMEGTVAGNVFTSIYTSSGSWKDSDYATSGHVTTFTTYSQNSGTLNGNVFTGTGDATVTLVNWKYETGTVHIKQTLSLTKQ